MLGASRKKVIALKPFVSSRSHAVVDQQSGGFSMPLVHVYWSTEKVREWMYLTIEAALPGIVSTALSVPAEAAFPPDEVTVRSFPMKPVKPDEGDKPFWRPTMSHDVEVIVWANHWPEREAQKAEITAAMAAAIRKYVPKSCSGFVWLLLQPAAFSDFKNGEWGVS